MSTIKKIGIPKDDRGNDPNDYRDVPDYLNELKPVSVLSQFTLNGKAAEMKTKMLDDKYVIGRIAILGQSTAIYAKPNAGKTLLTIWLIKEGIEAGELNGQDVFYINADDNYKGLVFKLELAEKHGFNMLAPGHSGFEAEMLSGVLADMIAAGEASGKVLVLDTVKKFADLMRKDRASQFGNAIRKFVSHGGSVIMLAHVNKHRDDEGKVVFAGTSDLVDDADCAYTLDILTDDKTTGTRTVKFENFKSRGDVALEATYQYDAGESVPYHQRLESVRSVDEKERQELERRSRLEEKLERNRVAIDAIKEAIRAGHTQKTALLDEARKLSGISKPKLARVLAEHTGKNLADYQYWHVNLEAKNAHVYALNWGVS